MRDKPQNSKKENATTANEKLSNEEILESLKTIVTAGSHQQLERYLTAHKIKTKLLSLCLSCLLDNQRKSPIKSNHLKCLELLAKYKAFYNSNGYTLLHFICTMEGDHSDSLEKFLEYGSGGPINGNDYRKGRSALIAAIKHNNVQCVKVLLRHGADSNQAECKRYSSEDTPLILSIKRITFSSDIFDALLDTDINVNKCCSMGTSPLIYAAMSGDLSCLKKLIERGASLKHVNYDGKSAYEAAAMCGHCNILDCLFEYDEYRGKTDRYGRSLVYWAVKGRHVRCVEYLFGKGHTIQNELGIIQPWQSVTVQHCCQSVTIRQSWQGIMVQNLYQNFDSCLLAISMNAVELIKALEVYSTARFETFDAIRIAVVYSSVEALEYLLSKYKYNINEEYTLSETFEPTAGITLLTEACHVPIVQVLYLLLKYGADPNKKSSKYGYTPLHVALSKKSSSISVVAALIRNGADVNIPSLDPAYGDVLPFETAVLHHNIYAVEMLLIAGCKYNGFSSLIKLNPRLVNYNIPHEIVKLVDACNEQLVGPQPLVMLCRQKVLQSMQWNAERKISDLPLPNLMKQFLRMPEFDEILAKYEKSFQDPLDAEVGEMSISTDSEGDY